MLRPHQKHQKACSCIGNAQGKHWKLRHEAHRCWHLAKHPAIPCHSSGANLTVTAMLAGQGEGSGMVLQWAVRWRVPAAVGQAGRERRRAQRGGKIGGSGRKQRDSGAAGRQARRACVAACACRSASSPPRAPQRAAAERPVRPHNLRGVQCGIGQRVRPGATTGGTAFAQPATSAGGACWPAPAGPAGRQPAHHCLALCPGCRPSSHQVSDCKAAGAGPAHLREQLLAVHLVNRRLRLLLGAVLDQSIPAGFNNHRGRSGPQRGALSQGGASLVRLGCGSGGRRAARAAAPAGGGAHSRRRSPLDEAGAAVQVHVDVLDVAKLCGSGSRCGRACVLVVLVGWGTPEALPHTQHSCPLRQPRRADPSLTPPSAGPPAKASCTSSSCASSCTPVTSTTQPSTAAGRGGGRLRAAGIEQPGAAEEQTRQKRPATPKHLAPPLSTCRQSCYL